VYDPSLVHDFLTDLTINIGKHSDVQSIDLEEQVRKCAIEYCSSIDADTLRLVLYSSNEAYFRALKTFEKALHSTLIGDDED